MSSVPVMVRADIAYDGSFAYGFQKQGELETVQGVLENTLRIVCGTYVPVVGASRTDRGVHALHNVISFVVRDDRTYERVARRLPCMLPAWITVRSVHPVDVNFNARFSTTGKTYAYVFVKQTCWNPFLARYAYRLDYPVQIEAMREAAHALVGTHDFQSFGSIDPSRPHRSTICTLYSTGVEEAEKAIVFLVSGDHFLYHMVRRMAYFVLKAGQGRIGTETLRQLFNNGIPAPYTRQVIAAGGLYLVAVRYACDEHGTPYRQSDPSPDSEREAAVT